MRWSIECFNPESGETVILDNNLSTEEAEAALRDYRDEDITGLYDYQMVRQEGTYAI